ncbi:hypothetical protein HDV05_001968 [Chytridiales sp. JEL 0842]|nr:hypothetical protein HDV05_001968 [Chytridiales sp. JEL 0842]
MDNLSELSEHIYKHIDSLPSIITPNRKYGGPGSKHQNNVLIRNPEKVDGSTLAPEDLARLNLRVILRRQALVRLSRRGEDTSRWVHETISKVSEVGKGEEGALEGLDGFKGDGRKVGKGGAKKGGSVKKVQGLTEGEGEKVEVKNGETAISPLESVEKQPKRSAPRKRAPKTIPEDGGTVPKKSSKKAKLQPVQTITPEADTIAVTDTILEMLAYSQQEDYTYSTSQTTYGIQSPPVSFGVGSPTFSDDFNLSTNTTTTTTTPFVDSNYLDPHLTSLMMDLTSTIDQQDMSIDCSLSSTDFHFIPSPISETTPTETRGSNVYMGRSKELSITDLLLDETQYAGLFSSADSTAVLTTDEILRHADHQPHVSFTKLNLKVSMIAPTEMMATTTAAKRLNSENMVVIPSPPMSSFSSNNSCKSYSNPAGPQHNLFPGENTPPSSLSNVFGDCEDGVEMALFQMVSPAPSLGGVDGCMMRLEGKEERCLTKEMSWGTMLEAFSGGGDVF